MNNGIDFKNFVINEVVVVNIDCKCVCYSGIVIKLMPETSYKD